jgi:uncharacterized membrane protein YsdA (DUF1294 family)
MVAVLGAGFFLVVVCVLAAQGTLPLAVPAVYGAASVTAFVFYRLDKSAAITGRRRTPEDTLLALGLLGGWPGALVAQQLFRHKCQKTSFQIMFRASVALNCAVLGWFWWANQ